jgi:predicted MFS family arabinose efflux permease
MVLLLSFALDLLLYSLVVSFLPARTLALGATPAVTGALFAAYAAGLLLATPPAGWLTDRLGARTTLLVGLVALLGATLLFAFADSLPSLALARAGQGISSGVTWTSGLALLVQLYTPTRRPRAFAALFMAVGVGLLVGPPLGGLLYTWGGFSAPFLVGAALVALDGCGRILFLPGRAHFPVASPASARMIRTLLQKPQFVVGLVATGAGASVLSLLEPNLPPLLAARFGLEPLMIGVLFGGMVLIFTLKQPIVAVLTEKCGAPLIMGLGLLICGLSLVELALSTTLVQASGVLAILALGAALVLTPAPELLTRSGQQTTQPHMPAASFGTIYVAYNLAYASGLLAGPLLSGAAISAFAPTAGLILCGATLLPLGLVLVLRRSHSRVPARRGAASPQP